MEKKILDSISDPFKLENFKVKKMEIIEKMTRKSQASGSNCHNDGNFNKYDGRNYGGDIPLYKFLYLIFIIWLM